MEFFTSMTSSVLSTCIVHPIDTVKTHYQILLNKNNLNSKNIKPLTIVQHIVKERGVIGLFRGLGSHLTTYPFFWGVYFQTKQYGSKFTNIFYIDKFVQSFGSAVIATTIVNPLFVLKVRTQTELIHTQSHNLVSKSYPKLVSSIFAQEGIRGFFKGWTSTQFNNVKIGIQLPLYDYLRDHNHSVITSSLISKLSASTLFYPFDLARTTQRDSQIHIPIMSYFREAYRKEGIRGMYRGVGLYNCVTAPNFILMMIFKELIESTYTLEKYM